MVIRGEASPPRVTSRPHSGRRRNDAARQDVLEAALRIVAERGVKALTMEGLAREARVAKQTIYRWWPGTASVLLEAAVDRAAAVVALPETGDPLKDIEVFLTLTYEAAGRPPLAEVLRAMASEAQRDPAALDIFQRFTQERRRLLRTLIDRAASAGAILRPGDPDALVDAAFGALWYRLLVGHRPVDGALAQSVLDVLLRITS